jgi:DNA repair ATPase RecN
MPERKEVQHVRDVTETLKEITSIVKENYLNSVELWVSLWEENLKVINSQLENWLNMQQSYLNSLKEAYNKVQKDISTLTDPKVVFEEIERLLALQKDYIDSLRRISNRYTKETFNLANRNTERFFSLFDECINLLRV